VHIVSQNYNFVYEVKVKFNENDIVLTV
jgi:hypothetical protein